MTDIIHTDSAEWLRVHQGSLTLHSDRGLKLPNMLGRIVRRDEEIQYWLFATASFNCCVKVWELTARYTALQPGPIWMCKGTASLSGAARRKAHPIQFFNLALSESDNAKDLKDAAMHERHPDYLAKLCCRRSGQRHFSVWWSKEVWLRLQGFGGSTVWIFGGIKKGNNANPW